MNRNGSSLLATICLLLAACGGGTTGGPTVASTPPPVTSQSNPFTLPPTPATTSGTYQPLASVSSLDLSNGGSIVTLPGQMAGPGAVTLKVDAATKTYTLTVNAGAVILPAGTMTMPATADIGITHNDPLAGGTPEPLTPQAQIARGDLVASTVPAGTDASGNPRALTSYLRLYNVGQQGGSPRYVSMAHWGQLYLVNSSGVASAENFKATQKNEGFLVFGPRTLASEMPVNGSATYLLSSQFDSRFDPICEEYGCSPPPTTASLAVNFATRQLDASIRHASTNSAYDQAGEVVIATHDIAWTLSGSTLIGANSDFAMPLSGAGTVHSEFTSGAVVPDIVRNMAGTLDGSFFGPQAAEVGGLWSLPSLTADGLVEPGILSPFVGQQVTP